MSEDQPNGFVPFGGLLNTLQNRFSGDTAPLYDLSIPEPTSTAQKSLERILQPRGLLRSQITARANLTRRLGGIPLNDLSLPDA